MKNFTKSILAATLAIAAGQVAAAPTFSPIASTTGISTTLINALLAPSSGVTVVAGATTTYQGTNTAAIQQSGTYTNFNIAPTSGSTPTLTVPNGIILTSGSAAIPLTNTQHPFSNVTGSGSNAQLSALSLSAGGTTATNDANVLSFHFNVAAGVTSVSAKFIFGTEEFPTQSVTDIFGFFVDGVNYAKFANGQLISNTPNNPTNFINNVAGQYGIEYDGLTQMFTVVGLLGVGNLDGSHTLTIGIADTFDSLYDSGVFIGGLLAGNATNGGINPTPEPETLALLAIAGAAAVAASRRRKSKA